MDWAQIQAEYEARFIVCSRCGKNTGNAHQGHYWQFCKVLGKMADKFHLCCPGDCELYEQDGTPKPADAEVSRQHCAGALDRIPDTPTIDTPEALELRALRERLEAERQRHEALQIQAEDYAREISEARDQERAMLADMIGLAVELLSTHDGCYHWDRVERARAVLGQED